MNNNNIRLNNIANQIQPEKDEDDYEIEQIKIKKRKVCIIMGVGPGLGSSLARVFAQKGFIVVVCRRNKEKLDNLVQEIREKGGKCFNYSVDCRKKEEIEQVVNDTEKNLGEIKCAIYNVGTNVQYSLQDTTERVFKKIWELNTLGGFLFGQVIAKKMVERKRGSIFFTGATASVRGNSGFTAFGASKAGLRSVAQSMAKELGSKGIHVAHVIVDGGIDSQFIRENFKDKLADIQHKEEYLLQPNDIAQVYYDLYKQKKSAWTFELDVRPYTEKW